MRKNHTKGQKKGEGKEKIVAISLFFGGGGADGNTMDSKM